MSIEHRSPFERLISPEDGPLPNGIQESVDRIMGAIVAGYPISGHDFVTVASLDPSIGHSILDLLWGCNEAFPTTPRDLAAFFVFDTETDAERFFGFGFGDV